MSGEEAIGVLSIITFLIIISIIILPILIIILIIVISTRNSKLRNEQLQHVYRHSKYLSWDNREEILRNQYLYLKQITDFLGLYLYSNVELKKIIKNNIYDYNDFYLVQNYIINFLICHKNNKPICSININKNEFKTVKQIQQENIICRLFEDENIPLKWSKDIINTNIEHDIRYFAEITRI